MKQDSSVFFKAGDSQIVRNAVKAVSLLDVRWKPSMGRRSFFRLSGLATLSLWGFSAACSGKKEMPTSAQRVSISGTYLPEDFVLLEDWTRDNNYFVGDVDRVIVDRGVQVELLGIGREHPVSLFRPGSSSMEHKLAFRIKNVGSESITIERVDTIFYDGEKAKNHTSGEFLNNGERAPRIFAPGDSVIREARIEIYEEPRPVQVFIEVARPGEEPSRFCYVAFQRLIDTERMNRFGEFKDSPAYMREMLGLDNEGDKAMKESRP